MTDRLKHQRGISMVFVLAALLITAILGTALVTMSGSGQLSNAFFSSSASARSAAQSGLIAAVTWLESSDDPTKAEILDLVNDWMTTASVLPANQYLPKSGVVRDADGFIEVAPNQKYKARILALDTSAMTISIQCEGRGKGRSRAVSTAVYSLAGLGLQIDPGVIPTNALQMDNGGFEINTNMIVDGNMSMKGQIQLNAPFITLKGSFRADTLPGGVKRPIRLNGGQIDFMGKTYFSGNVDYRDNSTNMTIDKTKNDPLDTLSGKIVFHDNAGFDGMWNMDPLKFSFPQTLKKSYYFTGGFTNDGDGQIDMNGHRLYMDGPAANYSTDLGSIVYNGINIAANKDASSSVKTITETARTVGFLRDEPDPEIKFNASIINKIVDMSTVDFGMAANQLTSEKLNTLYEQKRDAVPSGLWNRFLVIKLGSSFAWDCFSNASVADFKYKLIILDYSREEGFFANFFNVDMDTGLVVIYSKNKPTNTSLMVGMSKFRGYIHLENCGQWGFQQQVNCTMRGAVYGNSGSRFNFNTHPNAVGDANHTTPGIQALIPFTTNTFVYGSDVVNELAALGLFRDPSSILTQTFRYTADRITATQISQTM